MRSLVAFLALAVCGCGSTVPDAPPVDASTDTATGSDGAADVGVDAPPDAGPDSATGDGSTVDGGSIDAGPGTYAAYGIIGGLDRVRIAKTVGTTCFYIQLVTPASNTGGLTIPSQWGFDGARAVQPAAACNPKYLGPISNSFDATSQSGTITFTGNGIPQTIQSVTATLTFANNPVWCPPSESFSATNVAVQ